MINYNRALQKKLSINIGDYIKASGKIKIIEKNGKGKEYSLDSNIIRFEGEYLNRKRTRLGKEFDHNGKLEFEGNIGTEKDMVKEKNIIIFIMIFMVEVIINMKKCFLMDKKVMIKKKKIIIYIML